MTKLRELLEEAKDCKWIYQALVSLAAGWKDVSQKERRGAEEWPDEGRPEDVRAWLAELKMLDPLRKMRWEDWGAKLGLRDVEGGSE